MNRQQRRRQKRNRKANQQADADIVRQVSGPKHLREGIAEQVTGFFKDGITPDRLTYAFRYVADFADESLALTRNANGNSRLPDCRAGCAWCCYQTVQTSPPEALAIAHHLMVTLAPNDLQAIKQRVASVDDVTRGMDQDQRFEALIPCPFLNDNMCAIYDVRPMSCRAYNSFEVDKCKLAIEDTTKTISVSADGVQNMIYDSLGRGFDQGVKSVDLDTTGLELAAAMRIALEQPDAIQRWIDGEPVFADAKVHTVPLRKILGHVARQVVRR